MNIICSVALPLRVTRPLGLFEDGYFKPFKVFMDFHPIEDNIICLLNWFKKDYFKNPLNGALIFHNYMI